MKGPLRRWLAFLRVVHGRRPLIVTRHNRAPVGAASGDLS